MMERLREVKVYGDRRMTVQDAITWFVAVIRARGTADKRAAWFAANGINLARHVCACGTSHALGVSHATPGTWIAGYASTAPLVLA